MSAPQPQSHPQPTEETSSGPSKLIRSAIWVAIGALIAAALVSVVWVLIGAQNGIVGRAFLTIFLLAAFAGVAILDAHLAPRRPGWFALTSMIGWVVSLLIGAFLIWMPERTYTYYTGSYDEYDAPFSPRPFDGFTRFLVFLLIVLIIQLAVLHVRLYAKAILRVPTTFNKVVGYITIGLVAALVIMLVLPLTLFEWVEFFEIYWRIVVAISILAAVGTALVPLVNVLFGPKRPRPTAPPLQAWPTYADGVTPLPVLPDGSPDWQAYYTGYPTGYAPQGQAPAAPYPSAAPAAEPAITPSEPPAAPAPTAYGDYPPPPPLPPR